MPNLQELRDTCLWGLPPGEIWTPWVQAYRKGGVWFWYDKQDDAPTHTGPFPTERAALLDAIAKGGA